MCNEGTAMITKSGLKLIISLISLDTIDNGPQSFFLPKYLGFFCCFKFSISLSSMPHIATEL
jgi:hypothetical protein